LSRLSLILTVVLVLTSCASLKKSGNNITWDDRDPILYLHDIKARNLTNQDFNIQKAEIEINTSGEKQKLLGSLKYKAPGSYLLTIRSKTGIEAVRIFISEDTIMVKDRIRKRLYYGSPSYIFGKYGISASALPLLTGDYIDNTERMEEKLLCDEGTSKFEGNIENKKTIYVFDCKKGKLINSDFNLESDKGGIIFSFGNFQYLDNKTFPGIIGIEDYLKETVIKIKIEKIDFEPVDTIEFLAGNDYEKIMLK
jgi:hypothetical protein